MVLIYASRRIIGSSNAASSCNLERPQGAILLPIAEIALNDNLNDAPAQRFGSLINSNTPRFLKRLTGLTPCSET